MPQVTDLANVKIFGSTQVSGQKLAFRSRVLAATGAILATEAPVQYVDCNGAVRNITLPAVAGNAGLVFHIRNTSGGAFALTVQDALAATVVALAQSAFATVHCDGVNWRQIS